MSKSFEIRYLKTAERDLEDIFEYIMKDSPKAAVSLLERFDNTISGLSQNPKLGVIPRDDRLKRLGYRILIVGRYLVFYIIKNKGVQIRRVIHGAKLNFPNNTETNIVRPKRIPWISVFSCRF